MAKWEAQFNQMMNSQREDLDFDYGGMMQNAWDGMNDGDFMTEPPMQFDEDGIPMLDSYVFGALFSPFEAAKIGLTLRSQRKTTNIWTRHIQNPAFKKRRTSSLGMARSPKPHYSLRRLFNTVTWAKGATRRGFS